MRLFAEPLLLRDVAADACIDFLFEHSAQPLGDLQVHPIGALIARALGSVLLDRGTLALADSAFGYRLDLALFAGHRRRGGLVVGRARDPHDSERQKRQNQGNPGPRARPHLSPSPPTYSSFQSSPS